MPFVYPLIGLRKAALKATQRITLRRALAVVAFLVTAGIALQLATRVLSFNERGKSISAPAAREQKALAVTVKATGAGGPFFNFRDGRAVAVEYRGNPNAAAFLQSGQAMPRVMTSIVLAADAVPDLITGYSANGTGIVTVQRGNPEAFAPRDDSIFVRMQQGYNPDSLLPTVETYQVPEPVDFIAAGDFNNDNRKDVLAAAVHGGLYLLAGNGEGGLATAERINLPGPLTTLATGEFRAADGKPEIAVGVSGAGGPELLIYDGAEGGVTAGPMKMLLPGEAKAVQFGGMDTDPFMDMVVATGSNLQIVHGWGRKFSPTFESRTEQIDAPSAVEGLAVGHFIWDRQARHEIAVLSADGTISILQKGGLMVKRFTDAEMAKHNRGNFRPEIKIDTDLEGTVGWTEAQAGWSVSRTVLTSAVADEHPAQSRLLITNSGVRETDDLTIIDGGNELRVLRQIDPEMGVKAAGQATAVSTTGDMALANLPASGSPVAAVQLPHKMNGERDLVVLQEGAAAPSIVTFAQTVIAVDRTDDPAVGGASTADNCTGVANDCSLRGAIEFANNNSGNPEGTSITVPANIYTLSINGGSQCNGNATGDLGINLSTTLAGAGAASTIIKQTGTTDGVMCLNENFTANLTYNFNGVTIIGGRLSGANTSGAGIIGGEQGNNVNITNSVIANNIVTGGTGQGGGGVLIQGGNLTITGSTIGGSSNSQSADRSLTTTGNSTNISGGGVSYGSGQVSIACPCVGTFTSQTTSTFSRNDASSGTGGGGGLDLLAFNGGTGSANISGTTFSNNRSLGSSPLFQGSGGGLILESTLTTTITNSTFSSNSATNKGGGVFTAGGTLTLDGTSGTLVFSGNTASVSGSSLGINNNNGVNPGTTVTGSSFSIDGSVDVLTNGFLRTNAGSTWSLTGLKVFGTMDHLGTALNVSGDLLVGVETGGNPGGHLDLNSSTVNLQGNLTVNDSGLASPNNTQFNGDTSNFNFTGSSAQTISGTGNPVFNFNNFTDANTAQPVSVNRNITVGGNLTINASAILDPAAATVISGTGTLTGNGTARVRKTTVTADFLNQYTITNKTLTNLTVEYIGAAAQVLSATTYGGLKINNSSGVTLSSGTATVNGVLTLSSGALSVGGATTLNINNGSSVGSGSLTSNATGTVIYGQASNGQSVITANYGNLTFSNFNKTLPATTVGVAGTFTPGSATGHTIAGNTFDFNGVGTQTVPAFNYNNLTISGNRGLAQVTLAPATIGVAGTFSPTATNVVYVKTSNTFDFNGAGAQTVAAFNYNNLTISGSRGGNTVALGAGTVGIAGVFTTSATSVVYSTTGNTVEYNGSSAQTMPSTFTTYNNLTLNNPSGVTPFSGLTANGLLRVQAGTFTSNDGTYKDVQIDSTTTLAGTSGTTINIGGSWTNNGTYTANTNLVNFNGSTPQTIGGSSATTFEGLTIASSSTVTVNNGAATVDVTVGGTLTLTSDLTLAASAILQQNGGSSGAGDVIGKVRRVLLDASPRAFGNPFNTIAIVSGTAPNPMDVTLVKSAPGDFAAAVKRTYTLEPTGGSGYSANVSLHYQDGDLNGNTETALGFWQKSAATWISRGRTGSVDTANNAVTLNGITSFSDWTLAAMPDVSVTVSPSSGKEDGGSNLVYTFARTGNTTGALTINFLVSGDATLTTDYLASGADTFTGTNGTITFAAGNANAAVTIDPVTDTTGESNETVVLTVDTGTTYNVGSPSAATGTINDDETTTLITGDSPDPSSSIQAVNVTYTVTAANGGTPTGNVLVSDGVDSNTCTVAAGTCSVTLTTIGNRTITATYQGDGNYNTSSDTEDHVVCGSPLVTSNLDDGSAGTLRQVIANACADATITFDIPGPGPHTITLSLGELALTKNLKIRNNSGERITVSGNSASRVFNVNSGKTVSIIGLTISGGSASSGGAILNDGTLSVVNSTLSGNNATTDGGAVSNTATATSLTLINTTISGNTANGYAGGVDVLGGLATILNSTITNNHGDNDNGGGGGAGGLRIQGGTVTMHNTIVAGNFAGSGTTTRNDIEGALDAASSHNLIGDGTNMTGITDGSQGNKIGTGVAPLDPVIGALADNGGTTQTHRILGNSSPAMDAGGNTVLPSDTLDLDADSDSGEALPVDQRGQPRVVDNLSVTNVTNGLDIGAYEAPAPPSAPDLDAGSDTGTTDTDNITGDNTPTFTIGGVQNGAFVELLAGASVVASGTATSTSIQLTASTLSDNTYSFTARQTVGGGLSPTSTGLNVTIDTAAPLTPTIDLQTGSDSGANTSDDVTNATTRTFDIGNTESGLTVELRRDGNLITSTTGNGSTVQLSDSTAAVSGTTYAYTARQIDTSGNTASSSTLNVLFDSTAPTVSSSVRANANPTSAAAVDFTVTFSENVTGVDTTDFTLTTGGGISGASVTGVTGSNNAYTVTVNTGSGDGTIRLDVTDNDSIADVAGNLLGGAGAGNGNFTTGQSYTVDKSDPTVSSIVRANPNPTNASSVGYTVNFSEAVTGVDTTDFTLTTTGLISAPFVSGVSGSGTTYTVTVNTGTSDGTIRLDVTDNDSIVDANSKPLGGTGAGNGNFTAGEVYNVDKTGPTVTINQATGQSDPAGGSPINFTAVFNEAVTGFGSSDIGFTGSTAPGTLSATITEISPNNGTTYTVAISGMTGPGNVVASVNANAAQDAAGNNSGASSSTDNQVTFSGDQFSTFEVNSLANTDDSACSALGTGPGNQDCTLREAINAANNDGGAETITFATALTSGGAATITLSGLGALPAITGDVTITGPTNNGLTISGNNAVRVFSITAGVVNISTLTVSGGAQGGGNGAGLLNSSSGTVTLRDMLFTGNTAVNGGAIATSAGTVNIYNSTISGNTASTGGGGVYLNGGTLTLINDTITNNNGTTQGGGLNVASGTANVRNTIITGNTATSNANVAGTINDQGNNLLTGDAKLAALANNGGPTMTHALLAGSPALDAGDNTTATNAALVNDQRGSGFNRIVDAGSDVDTTQTVDIGAFEADPSVEDITDKATAEDTALPSFSFNIGDAATSAFQSITATSSNTTLVPNGNIGLSGSGSSRSLSITPAANQSGTTTITVTVTKLISGGSRSMTDTFVLTVGTVPDTPSVTNAATSEDTQTTSGLVITKNAADGAEVTHFKITNITGGTLFKNNGVTAIADNSFITVAEGGAGLRFTPAANSTTSGSFQVQSSTDATGTVLSSGAATATITVTPVADTPSVTNATTNEDTQTSSGLVVSRNAADGVEVTHFKITAISNGTLFKNDGTTAINNGDFITFAEGSAGLRFTPAANLNTPGTTFSFAVQGATSGAGAGLSTGSATATITVNAVNDVPSFTKGADQTVLQNSGSQTVPNWATSISAGPSDESSQVLTFEITNNTNPGLFSAAPAVSSSGTLTYTPTNNVSGTAAITLRLKDNGGTSNGGVDTSATQTFNINVMAAALLNFSASTYNVNENGGSLAVLVNRTGDSTVAVTVDYATSDNSGPASVPCSATPAGQASSRCDYNSVFGTLRFAIGENQKTILVPITRDAFTEGPENFTISLSNPTGPGANLVTPSTATITINDSASPTANAIDDTEIFVRQQYHDFLNREADPTGLAFWKDNIDKCNDPARRPAGLTVAQCIEVFRIHTSAAFFLSIEFQKTGGLVRDAYVAALDRPATNNMPAFVEFMRDTQAVQAGVIMGQAGWETVLNNNRTAFMNDFVMRTEFVGLYPTTDTPTQYVDKLYAHAAVPPGDPGERAAAIAEFGAAATASDPAARGRALLRITQNANFQAREFNRAFVQMQYFGYLRRNPNDPPDGNFNGYNFWLNKLNAFNGNFIAAEMVKAFITSTEYRQRFGP